MRPFKLFLSYKQYHVEPPELKEVGFREPKTEHIRPIAPSCLPTVASTLGKETNKQTVGSDMKASQTLQKGELKQPNPIKTEISIKDMQN